VRPFLPKERAAGLHSGCVSVVDNVVILSDPTHDEDDILRGKRAHDKQYAFDYVFPDHVTNEEVFAASAYNLIEPVMSGFNATVFAYGATGAGKTHTMLGDADRPGVMVCTLKSLFQVFTFHEQERHRSLLNRICILTRYINTFVLFDSFRPLHPHSLPSSREEYIHIYIYIYIYRNK
jgi:hypothetical protein